MIKIGIRHNLFYPSMLIILNLIKDIELTLLKHIFSFKRSSLSVALMFLSEFIAGIIFSKYEKRLLTKVGKEEKKHFMGIKLIHSTKKLEPPDSTFKMFFLIFSASFFD